MAISRLSQLTAQISARINAGVLITSLLRASK